MSEKIISQENKLIGNRIKRVREKMHLTQEVFADKLDISVSAYKKLESGENGISTKVLKELRKLDVSSDYVLFGECRPVKKIWYDVDNCTEEDKMEIFLRLILEYTTDNLSGEKLSKEKVNRLISTVFRNDKS